MRKFLPIVGIALGLGCALGAPERPAPDRSSAWGYVSLMPHPSVPRGGSSSATYGDRRLRYATLVDYTRPGFAVVYVEQPIAKASELVLRIESRTAGPRLVPSRAALSIGDPLRVENRTSDTHVLSCPEAGVLQTLAAGESLTFALSDEGEAKLYLLDVAGQHTTLFAAPGSFSIVSDAGRYALEDLEPGRSELHTWHARFPPTTRWIELAPGRVIRQDLDVGAGIKVGREDEDAPL